MSLRIESLCIALGGQPPLFPPLTLEIPPGAVATIMGPSGIGKSTLLDAIAGHLTPGFAMTGRALLNGKDVTHLAPETRRIGLMFQEALLFPHLSVADNLAFGLAPHVKGRAARAEAVDLALAQAGLAGMGRRDPATLSGGQRARVALMRTLLAEPQALLLDEPFSKLDAGLRDDMRSFAFDHIRQKAIPALMVTHDPQDAAAARGPVIQLDGPISPLCHKTP